MHRKTEKPIGAIMARNGLVHAGHFSAVSDQHRALQSDRIWHDNTERLDAGQGALFELDFAGRVSEFVYPTLSEDAFRKGCMAYRDVNTGEEKLSAASDTGFAPPVAVAPSVARVLLWNPQIALALGGGVQAVRHADEQVFLQTRR